jgi:GH25 family lysozyme M1 (1,4-beta-N-acetylmuramidase)
MTRLRVVALAQALTMTLLLLPGPASFGPAAVHAARRAPEPQVSTVFDQAGKGVGCQTGGGKYKGPGLRKDPPWPPGAKPTPTPNPTPEPSASAEASPPDDADATPAPSPGAATDEPEAAAYGVVQAEVGPDAPRLRRSSLLTGIDVSHHNGDIDYAAVREAGHRFVFAKATQDNDFIDPMFPTNIARARAAGLAVGAYHFFDYTLDGREQADHFIDRVEAANGIDDALPPVIDVECWAPIGSSLHALSAARLRDLVERVYERTGRIPLIYTSVYMWQQVVGNADGFEDLPLWAACWGCEVPPAIAPGWESWTFWQEGLTRIPGVGRLDGNYFVGNGNALRSLKLRPFRIVSDGPASGGGAVELDLGGRAATHIRTSPDGEDWSSWERIRSVPTATIPTEEGEHQLYAQLRYGAGLRSPVVSDSIVVDATPPTVSEPTVSLRTGALGSDPFSLPVAVTWEASDAVAGLADATIAVACGERSQRTQAPGQAEPGRTAAWEGDAFLVPATGCSVTAIGADGAGNEARGSVNGIRAAVVPAEGAAPSAMVEATDVGVIARRGPDDGRASVVVDGEPVALVDLYAEVPTGPEVVHVMQLPAGAHEINVEATDSADPASTGSVVVIEGFATLG